MSSSSRKRSSFEDDKELKKSKQDQIVWNFTSFLIDVVAGYLSWSMLVQLAPDIFFYPMVAMEFTGSEIFLCSLVAPAVLGIGSIKKFATTQLWLFRLLSGLAFISYYMPEVIYKLPLLGLGVAFDLMGTYGLWLGASNKERRDRAFFGHFLGLITLISVRIGWRSLDPVWVTTTGNVVAIVASLVCAMRYLSEGVSAQDTPSFQANGERKPSWIISGLALGSLYFLTHIFLTESGIVSRWTELPPFPHGIAIVLAMGIGITLSAWPVVTSFLYWFGMALGAWILFISSAGALFPPYIEFTGGVLLAVYTMSVWYTVIEKLVKSENLGKTFLLAGVWYCYLQLWAVYVVAYKFVPCGFLLRERSKSMVFFPLVCIGLSHVKTFLPAPLPSTKLRSQVTTTLFMIFLLVLAPCSVFRMYHIAQPPLDSNPSQIKPLAWAIHFGYNNLGVLNLADMTDTIRRSGANVIGMVETDAARHFMGNRDVIQWLAEELHFYSDYGPSAAQNTWGCALLSVWPIERSERVVMPSPEGELACLIDADLDIQGTSVNVIVAHFGNTEDTLDLKLQADYLEGLISVKKNTFTPTIFIGYLTMEPYSERYAQLMQAGFRDTSNSLDRYCLYILYKDLKYIKFDRYPHGDISDTEAQVATLELTKPAPPINPTPEFCRKVHNDSVGCQVVQKCGWCQLRTSGFCYEPTQRGACLSFNGTWIGPEDSTKETEELRRNFIQIQYQQQLKALHPLVLKGNSVVWRVDLFHELDEWAYGWYSAIFEAQDAYWRLAIFMDDKSKELKERTFKAALQIVQPKRTTVNISIGLLSPDGQHSSTKKNLHVEFEGTPEEQVEESLVDFEELQTYIQGDSFKVEVTFH